MNVDVSKIVEEAAHQFPVAVVIFGTCLLCWMALRRSFEQHLKDKDEEIKRLAKLLEDAQAKRDQALKDLHKYLPKPGERK